MSRFSQLWSFRSPQAAGVATHQCTLPDPYAWHCASDSHAVAAPLALQIDLETWCQQGEVGPPGHLCVASAASEQIQSPPPMHIWPTRLQCQPLHVVVMGSCGRLAVEACAIETRRLVKARCLF